MFTNKEILDSAFELSMLEEWPGLIAHSRELDPDAIKHDWNMPVRGCLAVGGSAQLVKPLVVAYALNMLSIILVDDILDDDDGPHKILGAGKVANYGLALQAAATKAILNATEIPLERREWVLKRVCDMMYSTSQGQDLDTNNLKGIENYWKVVQTKSVPFYAIGFEIGAIAAGASAEVCRDIYNIGFLIGEIVQIEDDIEDAFSPDGDADWLEGRNNLLMMFAENVNHPDQAGFIELRSDITADGAIKAAQGILIRSGALSYAIYQLIARWRTLEEAMQAVDVVNRDVLTEATDGFAEKLQKQFELYGIDVPIEAIFGEALAR